MTDDIETIVVFRRFQDGDIVALFPAEIANYSGDCLSYQHVGQHGAADYVHCLKISRAAGPNEYQALRQELESMGYNLAIRQRFNRGHHA